MSGIFRLVNVRSVDIRLVQVRSGYDRLRLIIIRRVKSCYFSISGSV